MKRILIIITRMYASRGDARDEFVTVWHGGLHTEHRIFTCQTGKRHNHILVIHGYEYPQNVERATERACTTVETALRNAELTHQLTISRVGVMFHPRQSWAPAAQRKIADGVAAALRKKGATVDFVESYHHGSVLERKLAQACLDRQDWAAELDQLWPHFLQPTLVRCEEHFGALMHALQNLVLPIRNDLNTWRRYNLDTETGREILRANEEDAPILVARARELVLDDGTDTQSVVRLMWKLADNLDEERKDKLIADLAELEKLFTPSDSRYREVEQLLGIFGNSAQHNRSQEAADDARLAEIRARIKEADPLGTWFQALIAALGKLRQAWSE